MSGKRRKIGIAVWLCIVLILLAACILTAPSAGGEDSIKEVMRDAVLHENDKISLLGVIEVNPAVLSDINAAISLGCLSYLVILSGGVAQNGARGVGNTLKDFSLPISMSFRLFGALLSGLLVTELVYYYVNLSFVLPVVVAVLFTLLHALIQTYVLTMLTALFYGEVSHPHAKKAKKRAAKV